MTSVAIARRENHQRDDGPSERLIAPPGLKASVKRRKSPRASCGTCGGHSSLTANRLVVTSTRTIVRKIVQNLLALCGMNLVRVFYPYGEERGCVSPWAQGRAL